MNNTKEIIKLESLGKTFPDGNNTLKVLDDINFTLNSNETVAVTGRSGCGKSTLLHILGFLDKPTGGTYHFEGKNSLDLSENDKNQLRNNRIGFIFQHFHLLPDLNVLENVLLPANLSGTSEESVKRAKYLLDSVGLTERIKHKPKTLSGGEMQRAAIARALINKPDLLLCDEPTGNLDKENADIIIKLLSEIVAKENAALVLVTHDIKITSFVSKTLSIENGKLE